MRHKESDMSKTTKDVLITATAELLGGDVAGISLDRLYHLITLTQHATDVLLNEIERRGEIYYLGGHAHRSLPGGLLGRDDPYPPLGIRPEKSPSAAIGRGPNGYARTAGSACAAAEAAG